jgi:hypothetical protein
VAMLAVAARLFHSGAASTAMTFIKAHHVLAERAGGGAALVFAVALLVSRISSSTGGTYAGQIVMCGFLDRRIPSSARRSITMLFYRYHGVKLLSRWATAHYVRLTHKNGARDALPGISRTPRAPRRIRTTRVVSGHGITPSSSSLGPTRSAIPWAIMFVADHSPLPVTPGRSPRTRRCHARA